MEKNKPTLKPITDIVWGLWSFRTLHTAIELELFTKIEEGKNTPKLIAESLKTDPRTIKRILNACISLDLLNKNEEKYINTSVAQQFLVKGNPRYYGDFITMFQSKDSLRKLKESILTNAPVITKLTERMENPEQARIFTKAMHYNAVGPAKKLSESFDFTKYSKLLDLGGGSGAFSIVLTQNHPNLNATVFELPKVCAVADEFIKGSESNLRVKTIVGNFVQDELPQEYDIVLISQILHSWSPEENKILLKKIYNSLPKGGAIIINEFLLDNSRTGPLFPALFALNMLVQSEGGNTYTEKEITSWLQGIGFTHLKTIKLGGPIMSIIAEKK